MKKGVGMVLAIAAHTIVAALPIGNPTEASIYERGVLCCDSCWSVRAGFYGDYVFNRHMTLVEDQVTDFERFTNSGLLVFNLYDRLDLFTTLGESQISFLADGLEAFFDPQFSWSLGGRATVWQGCSLGIGIEGEYFRTRPALDRFFNLHEGVDVHIDRIQTTYSEWQLGVGASYSFATPCATISLVPYMGLAWASAHMTDDFFGAFHSRKHWSYAVGTSMVLREGMGVTVEGRFSGEKAFHVNGQVKF